MLFRSARVLYQYKNNSPSDTPSAPDVEIEDYKLTAKVTNIPSNVSEVEFVVLKDNVTFKTNSVRVVSNQAVYTITIEAGGSYRVKCRYVNANGNGEWSSWSGESKTKPNAPTRIKTCRAETETSVYLDWDAVENATSYDLEYSEKREYLEGSNQTSTQTGIRSTSYILSGLESGREYVFRLRAVNSQGESGWTGIVSVIVGTEPAAPTTWSSTTTVVTGEQVTLYWVHNSEDGSTQTKANIELTIDGNTIIMKLILPMKKMMRRLCIMQSIHLDLSKVPQFFGVSKLLALLRIMATGLFRGQSRFMLRLLYL